jgi:hypothetical protein
MLESNNENPEKNEKASSSGQQPNQSNEDANRGAKKTLFEVIEALDEETRVELDKVSIEDLVDLIRKDRDTRNKLS